MNRIEFLRKLARTFQYIAFVLVIVIALFQILFPERFQATPLIGTVAYYAIIICIAVLLGVNGFLIAAIFKNKHK